MNAGTKTNAAQKFGAAPPPAAPSLPSPDCPVLIG